MSALSASILVGGLLVAIALHHWLAMRRLERRALRPATDPTTPDEERRMTMSKQQLNTLGLSHVRRRIAAGKYTPAEVKRWKDELGEGVVQQLIDDAKASSSSAPKKSAPSKSPTTEE